MRRFHNPRFAPEFLERKLNPSGVTPIPVAAEVYIPTDGSADGTTGGTTGGTTDPAPLVDDGTPPEIPPIIPIGPVTTGE